MFTGIIEEVGMIRDINRSNNKYQLKIGAARVLQDIKRGESIAVNGVCLTVVNYNNNFFMADIMPETLQNTNLRGAYHNVPVNLEQPVTPEGFFSGHLVTGHIDGTGEIINIKKERNARLVTIKYPSKLGKFIVEKGSVALNGISLTVVSCTNDFLKVSLIPETWQQTNFNSVASSDEINIETDLIGKYVAKMIPGIKKEKNIDTFFNKEDDGRTNNKIDKSFLKEKGF